MTRKYEVRTKQTLDTINRLLDNGIKKISVLIRHSDRFFSDNAGLEAFMGLTDKGKDFAVDFGTQICAAPLPELYSSFMGRCIETAYLIDKGFTKKNGRALPHNCLDDLLSPFYIKDLEKALLSVEKLGTHAFLRNWFDKKVDETIMENPEKAADLLSQFMIEQIKRLKEDRMAVCVSHDWNIFSLKEFKMGLQHETSGDVGYLDGVVFFEKEDRYYITNYQSDPVLL